MHMKAEDLSENSYDQERINRVYAFPASQKAAEVHRRATKFGYNAPTMKDGSETPICPCCENPVNTVEIPLCYGTSPGTVTDGERVFLLNSGTAMYFTFVKLCIYYLLLRLLVVDGFNMWSSYRGHFCSEQPDACERDYNSYLSAYNKHTTQDQRSVDIVDYLNIGLTLASIVFFFCCRKYQYKVDDLLEHSNVSQDDFSILIENIPVFVYEEEWTVDDVKYEYEKFIKDCLE